MTDKNCKQIKDGDKLRVGCSDSYGNYHNLFYRVFLNEWFGCTMYNMDDQLMQHKKLSVRDRDIDSYYDQPNNCWKMCIYINGHVISDIEIVE